MKVSDHLLENLEAYLWQCRYEGRNDSFSPEARENGRWWAKHFNNLREYELYCFCNSKKLEQPDDLFVDSWY